MPSSDRRRVLLGLAHKAAKQLGWDDAFRRDRQQAVTGHASCAGMTDSQLAAWCWHLKRLGAKISIPGPARASTAWGRPSEQQLTEIERLALAFGWDGLDDRRLAAFVKRTVGVDSPRFMTAEQASAIISGLRRWQMQRQRGGGK